MTCNRKVSLSKTPNPNFSRWAGCRLAWLTLSTRQCWHCRCVDVCMNGWQSFFLILKSKAKHPWLPCDVDCWHCSLKCSPKKYLNYKWDGLEFLCPPGTVVSLSTAIQLCEEAFSLGYVHRYYCTLCRIVQSTKVVLAFETGKLTYRVRK